MSYWQNKWNETIENRRADGDRPFQKGDFAPESPAYSLPNDVYAHPAVKKAEKFFVDSRENPQLNPAQLSILNVVQNEMRDELAKFSSMVHGTSYENCAPMNKYFDEALSDHSDKSLSWKIVNAAANQFLERAILALEGNLTDPTPQEMVQILSHLLENFSEEIPDDPLNGTRTHKVVIGWFQPALSNLQYAAHFMLEDEEFLARIQNFIRQFHARRNEHLRNHSQPDNYVPTTREEIDEANALLRETIEKLSNL